MALDYLILGSTGLLGQALIKVIKENNKSVMGIARTDADINFDITDFNELAKTISDLSPSVIINTVAIVSHDICEKDPKLAKLINAEISKFLSNYCLERKIKYIYISTDHYFTHNKDHKHNELCEVNLNNVYSETKFLGEEYSAQNPDALIIRTNIVGFRYQPDRPTFVEWAINALENQEKMNLFTDFYTSSIDVNSFSKALLELISKDISGVINLASSEVSSKRDFIVKLAEKLDFSIENTTECAMMELTNQVNRNESLGLDVSKAEGILGHPLPTLQNVIDNLTAEYLNDKI